MQEDSFVAQIIGDSWVYLFRPGIAGYVGTRARSPNNGAEDRVRAPGRQFIASRLCTLVRSDQHVVGGGLGV
jgi:hypothetical protein